MVPERSGRVGLPFRRAPPAATLTGGSRLQSKWSGAKQGTEMEDRGRRVSLNLMFLLIYTVIVNEIALGL